MAAERSGRRNFRGGGEGVSQKLLRDIGTEFSVEPSKIGPLAPLAELLAAIESTGGVSAVLLPHVVAHLKAAATAGLRAADDTERRRLAPLHLANQERAEAAEAVAGGIRRAADKYLTPAKRRVEPNRRAWPRLLWLWLWSPHRCLEYGFEERPSLRTVRNALKTWTSPHGAAVLTVLDAVIDETERTM